MADKLKLKAQVRDDAGSASAKKARDNGQLPAIVYGHKKESVAITVSAHDFVAGLRHGHRLMDLSIGSKNETVIVKEVQYDHLGRNIIHADLVRVSASEKITVNVPIELKGTAKGTHEGGMIEEQTDHIEVECKATAIPESIAINIKEVGVGDHLCAKDIVLPDGVKLISDPEMVLVTCHVIVEAKTTEEMEEEQPSTPEIISEKKDDEPEAKE